jgi:hypothetical protein
MAEVVWVRAVAAAGLVSVLAAGCGSASPGPTRTPNPTPTPSPTPQVQVNVPGLVGALSGQGFECGASAFYPPSPGVQICTATSGPFTQEVDVVGQDPLGFSVHATLHDPGNKSRPTADLVRSTYAPIMPGLFAAATATTASRWLTDHAGGDARLTLGQVKLSLTPPTQFEADLTISAGQPDPGTQMSLPTDAGAVQQYAQAKGLTSCAPSSGTLVLCQKQAPGQRTELAADPPLGRGGSQAPNAAGAAMATIIGPAAPESTYGSQVATLLQGLLRLELPAATPAADRATQWIASQVDGLPHSKVFGGLSVDVRPLGASGQTIQSLDVQIRPATVS